MKKAAQRNFCITGCLMLAFAAWTALIQLVDAQAIGPRGSVVGFAALNGFFHKLTGVHMLIYTITDWLGLVPLGVILGFATLGLVQLIQRKSLLKVDYSLWVLGGFYVLVLTAYMLFEVFVINYRPVLIDGFLEASYPSSTTLLVMCVMPTALMQLNERMKSAQAKQVINCIFLAFTAFMVIGRLASGVHWLTDIVGGALLSGSLVMLYYSVRSVKAGRTD